MVNKRRSIKTEQDRFGGYAIQTSQRFTTDEDFENAPISEPSSRLGRALARLRADVFGAV